MKITYIVLLFSLDFLLANTWQTFLEEAKRMESRPLRQRSDYLTLTGKLKPIPTVSIRSPAYPNLDYQIKYLAPHLKKVKKGDVLVEFDQKKLEEIILSEKQKIQSWELRKRELTWQWEDKQNRFLSSKKENHAVLNLTEANVQKINKSLNRLDQKMKVEKQMRLAQKDKALEAMLETFKSAERSYQLKALDEAAIAFQPAIKQKKFKLELEEAASKLDKINKKLSTVKKEKQQIPDEMSRETAEQRRKLQSSLVAEQERLKAYETSIEKINKRLEREEKIYTLKIAKNNKSIDILQSTINALEALKEKLTFLSPMEGIFHHNEISFGKHIKRVAIGDTVSANLVLAEIGDSRNLINSIEVDTFHLSSLLNTEPAQVFLDGKKLKNQFWKIKNIHSGRATLEMNLKGLKFSPKNYYSNNKIPKKEKLYLLELGEIIFAAQAHYTLLKKDQHIWLKKVNVLFNEEGYVPIQEQLPEGTEVVLLDEGSKNSLIELIRR